MEIIFSHFINQDVSVFFMKSTLNFNIMKFFFSTSDHPLCVKCKVFKQRYIATVDMPKIK